MSRKKLALSIIIALFMVIALQTQLSALVGDCNGDATVNTSDATHIVNWMFAGGVRPVMPDCDCDGFPGLGFGDLLQLIEHVFGTAALFGYPNYDYPVPSLVNIDNNVWVPPNNAGFNVKINIEVPLGFDIEEYIIPFSYAQQPGTLQAPLTCNSVDFTGSVAVQPGNIIIDNVNKKFTINSTPAPQTIIPGGSRGLLCTVNFTSGNGNPTPLIMSATDKAWPMLFAQKAYAGANGQRVYLPAPLRAKYGDVNCDGKCNVSDAVYIINYVFIPGAPKPGDCEPPD